MIVTSLGRMIGRCALVGSEAYVPLAKDGDRDKKPDERPIANTFTKGIKLLKIGAMGAGVSGISNVQLEQEASGQRPVAGRQGDTAISLKSGTFGPNNPLTLSHVAELWWSLDETARYEHGNDLTELMEDAKALLGERLKGETNIGQTEFLQFDNSKTYYTNAFVPVRALRTATVLGLRPDLTTFRRFFESMLHDQLSFSSIPDSRFDPGELIFCVEGLLLAPLRIGGYLLMSRSSPGRRSRSGRCDLFVASQTRKRGRRPRLQPLSRIRTAARRPG
jgi:hypothetical protein